MLLIGFALRNAGLTGMVLVAVGLLANLTVIAVDRGMPVRGLPAGVSDGWRHHGERPGDHLTGLADVVRLTPLGETVSAGDIVLVPRGRHRRGGADAASPPAGAVAAAR